MKLLHGKTDSSVIQLVRSVAVSNAASVSFAKIHYLVSRVIAATLGLAHRPERR
jgi:hypothetical protein